MSRALALHAAALAGCGASFWFTPEPYRLHAVAGVVAIHLLLVTKGVWDPKSSILCPTLSRGNDHTKIALTFDDGPGDATRQVLAILRENGILATFFVVGENVKGREDVLRAIVAAGHTVGSHSYRHSRFTNFLLAGSMRKEIDRGVSAIAAVIGKRPRLYRPPIGLRSPALARAARALDVAVIGWRRKARDGGSGKREPGAIVARLLEARGGEVILLHDGVEPGRTGDRTPTLQALRESIPLLKARGFTFTTVDKLLEIKPYS